MKKLKNLFLFLFFLSILGQIKAQDYHTFSCMMSEVPVGHDPRIFENQDTIIKIYQREYQSITTIVSMDPLMVHDYPVSADTIKTILNNGFIEIDLDDFKELELNESDKEIGSILYQKEFKSANKKSTFELRILKDRNYKNTKDIYEVQLFEKIDNQLIGYENCNSLLYQKPLKIIIPNNQSSDTINIYFLAESDIPQVPKLLTIISAVRN